MSAISLSGLPADCSPGHDAKYEHSNVPGRISDKFGGPPCHNVRLNRLIKWSTIANEQSAVGSLRPLRSEIFGDSPARLRRGVYQLGGTCSRADESCSTPVPIRKAQLYDFAGTRPISTRQQPSHGLVGDHGSTSKEPRSCCTSFGCSQAQPCGSRWNTAGGFTRSMIKIWGKITSG